MFYEKLSNLTCNVKPLSENHNAVVEPTVLSLIAGIQPVIGEDSASGRGIGSDINLRLIVPRNNHPGELHIVIVRENTCRIGRHRKVCIRNTEHTGIRPEIRIGK